MSTNKQPTGHARNVANFKELIKFCVGCGPNYNPVKKSIKIDVLKTAFTEAQAALESVEVSKTALDNAIHARMKVFAPLRKLSTRIVSALDATDVKTGIVNLAVAMNKRIQGRRIRKKTKAKKRKVARMSFDDQIEHFDKLIRIVGSQELYKPNEADLRVASLKKLLARMKASNGAIRVATNKSGTARIFRNEALYSKDTGLLYRAQAVKKYVKSLYGAKSKQLGQAGKIRFKIVP